MWFKRILLSVGIFAIARISAQNSGIVSPSENVTSENTTGPSNSLDNITDTTTLAPLPNLLPIYSIHCNISENSAVNLIRYQIVRSPNNSTIAPQDVIDLLQSKNLIIAKKLIDVKYEDILYVANIKIIDFLRNLTGYVPQKKSENLRKISAAFAIDFNKYRDILTEDDNAEMWTLLRTGKYTEESIQNALTIMQKSENSLLDAIGSLIFDNLGNLSLESVLSEFDDEFDALFDESSITLNEMIKYPTLNKAFHNVSKTLIDSFGIEAHWATAVSAETLVTANFTSTADIDLYVKNIENMDTYKTSQPNINNMFSILTVQSPLESYINISDKPLENPDCWYFTHINGSLIHEKPENATFTDDTIVMENNGFVHKLGAPLICNNLLYGLLVKQNETEIVFATTFSKCQSDKPTELSPIGNNSASRNVHINFVLAIGIMISCAVFIL